MRRAVGAVVLTLALAGCGPNPFVRPAPDRVIPINVGGRIMDVPGGNLDMAAPTQVSNSPPDQGVALFVGRAPDFAARSPETEAAFRTAGSDSRIRVLLSGMAGTTLEERLAQARSVYLNGDERAVTPAGADGHYVIKRGTVDGIEQLEDVFLERDGSFTVCARKAAPIRSPSCQMWFGAGPNVAKMRFGRRWLDTRETLKSTVLSKLESWTRSSGERTSR